MPGCNLRLEGPAPSTAVLGTTSDHAGLFEFGGLEPGFYRILAAHPSLAISGGAELSVGAGGRVSLHMVASLPAAALEIQVTASDPGEPVLFDRESISGQSRMREDTLQALPLASEQVVEALPLLPSVIRDHEGRISIGGTLPADSILLFNGVDVMDPFSGEYRLLLPLEAVDSVSTYTGVYPSNYGQFQGGIVDVSTAAGGDEWAFQVASFLPRPNLSGGTLMGIESASPRVRISGPLRAGRLFLSQSFEYHFDRSDAQDVPGDPVRDDLVTEGWNNLTQLDWHPSERHQFRLGLLAFPQNDAFAGIDGLTPVAATNNIERDAEALLGQHRWGIDHRRTLETTFQTNRVGFRSAPQGPDPLEVIPEGVRGNAFHTEDRETTHRQAQTVYTHFFGDDRANHWLQIGAEAHWLSFKGAAENGPILVRGAGDRLLQQIRFEGGEQMEGDKTEWGAFIQDRWQPSQRYWINLGLRASGDSISSGGQVAPHAGLAFDLLGDGKTLLKVAAGLLHRRIFLGEAFWNQFATRIETEYLPDGSSVRRAYAPRIADSLAVPYALLTTVECDHRFNPDLVIRARYSQREGRDQIVVERVEPQAGLTIGPDIVLTDTPMMPDPAAYTGSLLLAGSGRFSAKQLELTASLRLPRQGQLYASYVRSSSEGDLNDFSLLAGELPDPIIRPNRRGKLSIDAPNRLLLWGTVNLPYGLIVAPVVEWRDGFPYSLFNEDQSYLGAANSERFPAFLSIDAQVSKDIRIKRFKVRAGVKLTNITGHFNPRNAIANQASALFGDLRNSPPFKIRAKISMDF